MKSHITQESIHQKVSSYIIGKYRRLLLAFSGGLDSTVLLHILTLLRDEQYLQADQNNSHIFTIRAIYVNHGLSKHADRWAIHCEQQCRQRHVPFTTMRITIDSVVIVKEGIESSARSKRYQALHNALQPGEVLLTAQHQNDQTETLILALKRGSGPSGLSGMAVNMPFHNNYLLRPLLTSSKTQIENYADQHNLCWIDDASNYDDRFDRNFLRKHILPTLYRRWPNFSKAVARSALLCAEQEKLLDELLAGTLSMLIHSDGSLQIKPLFSMSAPHRWALLRRWLASHDSKMPSRRQLIRIWQEVVLSRRDASPRLVLDNRILRRFRDRLYLILAQEEEKTLYFDNIVWSLEVTYLLLPPTLGMLLRSPVELPENKVLFVVVRAPNLDEKVSIRFARGYGLLHIHITGRLHGRPLKKIWKELEVPPWQRMRTPLLFYNDTLIAAIGVFVTSSGAYRDHDSKWWLYWFQAKA